MDESEVITRSSSEASNDDYKTVSKILPEGEDNLPEEKSIRLKDLDTGRELVILKVENTITDLNTGKLYALTEDNASEEDRNVTDVFSGKVYNIDELNLILGLRPTTNEVSHGPDIPQIKKKKNWLNRITFNKKPRSFNDNSDSDSSSKKTVTKGCDETLSKNLSNITMIQSIAAHEGIIWVMKLSLDGKYLATAGQDAAILVWLVMDYNQENQQILKSPVVKRFIGHKEDILDISWSKTHFILSASMDKTVRLWHLSLNECLRVFRLQCRHGDFVTSLSFHPTDDKFFLSGSIDGKLFNVEVRIWNIPEESGKVLDYANVHEMVTAVAFSSDGSLIVVGTMKGQCQFFQCTSEHRLEYQFQIDVRNSRGKLSKGKKITGLQFLPDNQQQLLITSNDSRIRLYDGSKNLNTQIRASFSANGKYVVCGSDDGFSCVWSTMSITENLNYQSSPNVKKVFASVKFKSHANIATVAIFGPEIKTCQVNNNIDKGFSLFTAGNDGLIKVFIKSECL